MSKAEKIIQEERKTFWKEVYVAYVSAANAMDKNGAKVWADIALEEFDKRFVDKKE